MIEIKELTKRYGNKTAVDNISFTVERGEILGFLGPNGAGKTTTMNIITGYISSSRGTVQVDGHEILEQPNEVKSKIGYLPEQPPLYMDMTVLEYLDFVYDIKKVTIDRKKHLTEIMDMVKITDVKGRLIKNLSKGYRQRVGLAQALLGNPEVLILDEPTVGLDPKQIIEMRNVIKSLGKNRTIILSSHIMQEISAICERIIIINKGKIVAVGKPENLSKALSDVSNLLIRIAGNESDINNALKSIEGIKKVHCIGSKEEGSFDFEVEADNNIDPRKVIFSAMASKGFPILMMKSTDMSLEEVFLQITNESSDVQLLSEEPNNGSIVEPENDEDEQKEVK